MNPEDYQFNAQSALNRQQIDAEQNINAFGMMQGQREVQAALVDQINPYHVIREIKLLLEGKEEDMQGNTKSVGSPLMNQEGINKMLVLIKSVVNINTIMSALDEKKINEIMVGLMDDIIDDLTLSWKQYGIQQKTDLDRVEGIIKHMTYMTLRRALKGGERGFLGKVTVENISSAPRMQPQKKEGFLSRFKL